MALNSTPRTWVTDEVVTAAEMNAEVRDAITGIQAAWTAYTPTITTGGVAITLGNGAIAAAYNQIGKTIFWRVAYTVGSTTSMTAGVVVIGLPVTAKSTTAGHAVGTFATNAPIGMGAWRNNATTTVQLFLATASSAATVATLSLVSGSTLFLNGTYEAA